jgi:sugar O-acyltransferase (sialic acid O-acetyltransferase NeuD family)
MENPVLILGATSLGKVALDIFNRNHVIVYGFLDDDEKRHGSEIGEISVLGRTDDEGFTKLIGKKCEAFVAVEDRIERKNLVEFLNETRHVQPVNALHDTAVISGQAEIGHGNLVAAGVLVGPGAKVGNHCLLHSRAVIDAEANLADFVQVGPGTLVGPGVTVGENAFLGAGVTVVGGVTIGKNARVGAGSVVIESVPANATVFGNPAKKV